MAAVGDRVVRNRAQVVLIGALALAVSLVVLAVVLNSAIYTENLATRSNDPGTGTAVDVRESVRAGVGGITDGVNEGHAGDEYATLYGSHLPAAMDEWRPMAVRHRVASGQTFRVATVAGREGTRIADEDSTSEFLPLGPGADSLGYSDPSWMVTAPAEVRSFHIADVDTGDVPSASPTDPKGAGTDVFYAEVQEVQGSGDVWRVAVYENSNNNVEVLVYKVGTGVVGTCSTPGPARIDLTGATVNSERCRPLTFFAEVDGLSEIHYVNGGNIAGTYELTVDQVGHDSGDPLKDIVDSTNYGDQCSEQTYADSVGTSPYAVAGIYSTTVDFRYVSQSVTYETEVRAAHDEAGTSVEHPAVTDFSVTDNSDGTDAVFDISWSASDPNSDSLTVTVELHNVDDSTTNTYTVTGGSAVLQESDDHGDEYEVTLTVNDGTNSRSITETHVADCDGYGSGCPP